MAFREDPVPVDLIEVVAGPMQVTIDADGRTPHPATSTRWPPPSPDRAARARGRGRSGRRGRDGGRAGGTLPRPRWLDDAVAARRPRAAVAEAEASALIVARTELTRAEEEEVFARMQFERTQTLVESAASPDDHATGNGRRRRWPWPRRPWPPRGSRIAHGRGTRDRSQAAPAWARGARRRRGSAASS